MTGSTGGCGSCRPARGSRIAREQVSQLRGLNREIDALHCELAELVKAHRPQLLAEQGCGALTAAILIGHTAGNERFRSDASFALQTGTAPIPCSSGQRTQHRLNRGGDRQLNHALHIIAITRAQRDPATKEYLARKEAEGKTKKGALRCLKRHLARRFYHLLAEPPADQQQAPSPSRSPSPSCPRSPRVPARSGRSSRSAQRPARWSASARPPDHDSSPGPFSGPATPDGERSPPTSHRRKSARSLRYTHSADANRRVLSPSAALDERVRDRQHPPIPALGDPSRLSTTRFRNAQIATDA